MIRPVSEVLKPSPYQSKLLDQRWENRRSQAMLGRDRICASCRRSDIPLQVHHIYYEVGREPWDYPDEAFQILCRGCHERWHKLNQQFRLMVSGRMPVSDFQILIAGLKVGIDQHGSNAIAMAIAQLVCEESTLTWLKLRMAEGLKRRE